MINLDLLSLSLVPARIANISKDVTVNEGSNVNLMCQAVGRPDANIIWKYHSPRGRLQGLAVYLVVFWSCFGNQWERSQDLGVGKGTDSDLDAK